MEVMEEGDLMDRVPVLLVRDREYYDQHQTVLQENICAGVVGGNLDFPRSASFASVKIVEWWEDEYYAAYRKNSGLLHLNETIQPEKIIVKASSPEKFVGAITKSADKLLEHIHVLSQEALDHADLTVLTATIGASALVKNCLWIYLKSSTVNIYPPKGDDSGGSLKISYKQYSEMTEALAERLLDLHVRLLSLYIIQDADCLHWENQSPFFESERGSYTIQMWWLYVQGTKQDLWNSVPPNMAKRVFAGMLNETLTILTVRYSQVIPSQSRSQLLLVDISNLLLCMVEILPSVCENGEALAGLNLSKQNKIIRDIHCKCQELFVIFLLRGISLGALYKVLRKGVNSLNIFNVRGNVVLPWIQFAMSSLFAADARNKMATKSLEFDANASIALELKILTNSSQANWSLLLKLLLMRGGRLSAIILNHLMSNLPTSDSFKCARDQPFYKESSATAKCKGFMCGRECAGISDWIGNDSGLLLIDSGVEPETKQLCLFLDPIGQANYQVVLALSYVITVAGSNQTIRTAIVNILDRLPNKEWSNCLDRRQVWNQKRPPWFEAVHHLVYPILDPIVNIIVSSMQTGATVYQTMALVLSCLTETLDCISSNFFRLCFALEDVLTTEIRPLGESILVQTIFSALYTKLLHVSETKDQASTSLEPSTEDFNPLSRPTICSVIAEAVCSIDEDHKHTDAIQKLSKRASELISHSTDLIANDETVDETLQEEMVRSVELDFDSVDFASDIILCDVLSSDIGKRSMKLLYEYSKYNGEWLLSQLGVSDVNVNEFDANAGQKTMEETPHLVRLMFHIGHKPFDQFLTGNLRMHFVEWFQTAMTLNRERTWEQISKRYEFQEGTKLSIEDTVMVAFITSQLKNN